MNYRIIALDIDGTLLNDNYELTEPTREAVRESHALGATVVLCTGRGPGNAIPVLERLGLEGVLITHNGAATVQTPGPKLLAQCHFHMKDVEELVHYCRQRRVHFDFNTAFELYAESLTAKEEAMYKQYMIEPNRVADALQFAEPVVKVTMFGTAEQMDRTERELKDVPLDDRLVWIRSGDYFIDVMSVEAGKGRALARFAQIKGVGQEEVLAIGNYFNDIGMLEYAGLGIAMDNSPEAVKRAADAVTASNNDDGVQQALMRYVLNR